MKLITKIAGGEAIPTGDDQTLPLRKLEAFSRSRLSVLLTFLHARIARKKSFFLQYATQFGAEFYQGACDAVLYGARLSMRTAAFYPHQDVKFIQAVGSFQWPLDQHPVGFIAEILF